MNKVMVMIKLNSDKGREIVSNYITALNGDEEARAIRDKIARDFISRRVIIIDNDYHEV